MGIIITSTTNAIKVDFSDQPFGAIQKGTWKKDSISSFTMEPDVIEVTTRDGRFHVSTTAQQGVFVVDTVNGVAPVSVQDLYEKLSTLIE